MPAATSFPSSRPDRGEPQQIVGAPAAPALPKVTLWPYVIFENTPGDRHATSPIFRGPAVIDQMFMIYDDDNGLPRPSITLNYGPSLIDTGASAGFSQSQLGTSFFTTPSVSEEVGGQTQGPGQSIPKWRLGGGIANQLFPLRFPIYLDTFQIMIRMGTQAVAGHMIGGYVRILEQVPPELIPNFL